MTDFVVSFVACALTGLVLWFVSHKSTDANVQQQWRCKPHWIALRLIVLFVVLHSGLVLLAIPTARDTRLSESS